MTGGNQASQIRAGDVDVDGDLDVVVGAGYFSHSLGGRRQRTSSC